MLNKNLVVASLVALALLGCVGCRCFSSSRVEARASYNVFADDCEVSLVAVGYVKE